jgi:endonuclease I
MTMPRIAGLSKRTMLYSALCGFLVLSASTVAAVAPGDIAIIGYQSDDPDTLAFVVLSPIAAGEVIRFTDAGWKASGGFRANEGGIAFTSDVTLTPGTVITRTGPFDSGHWSISNTDLGTGGFLLSSSGDQVLAFQGDAADPAFIYALNADDTGWADATSSNTTALPTGLVAGTTAVNIGGPPEADNGYYNGITQGTRAQLLAAIGDPANWVTGDNVQTWPAWSFTINSGTPAVAAVSLPASTFDTGASAVVTVQLDSTPAAGSPATVSVASGAFAAAPATIVISNPANTGTASVTMANNGTWSATASAVNGCAGSATSPSFTVGSAAVAPVAWAGDDRIIVLSGSSVSELMTGATADDADGLTGLTYTWTPATGAGIVRWTSRTGSVIDPTDPGGAQVTVNRTGVYSFTLTVTDANGLTGVDSVTLTVIDASPSADYDPPPHYYDAARPGGAWYTGPALKSALYNIIATHTVRSYDAAKSALQLLDEDPNNSDNLILVYTGVSVRKPWDGGVTWNREHTWPDSLDPSGACDSDLFNLRPCNPNVNSSRGNLPFGLGSAYWDPNQGGNCRGELARALFYMATCYADLALVNGIPAGNQMGDLSKLIVWHYENPVDRRERRRNHLIYSSTDNPSYYQGNRNPFVDYPELVWTFWGAGPNDSKLYVGETAPEDGTSSATVNLGAVIQGAPMPAPQTVTLHKIGNDPTTFNVIGAGDAVSPSIGPRQAFPGGEQTRAITVGLSSSTAPAGAKSGTIVIDNTDLTSAGSGMGSADGNDTVYVWAEVREHADASFASATDQKTLMIDFGTVQAGTGVHTQSLTIYNRATVPGFTAALDLDSIQSTGNTAMLYTDLAPFRNLAAGTGRSFTASFHAGTAAGTYQSTQTLVVSDEDLPGAQPGASIVLVLKGTTFVTHNAADLDADGDVDLTDFSLLQGCFNGPNRPPATGCRVSADLDADADVDLADFAVFQACFNGPNRPAACP